MISVHSASDDKTYCTLVLSHRYTVPLLDTWLYWKTECYNYFKYVHAYIHYTDYLKSWDGKNVVDPLVNPAKNVIYLKLIYLKVLQITVDAIHCQDTFQ